ncbi:hypothetical protein D3C75_515270 [compost metagenome]
MGVGIVRTMRPPNLLMLSNEKTAVRSNACPLSNYPRLRKPSIDLFRSQGHSQAKNLPRPGEQLHGRVVLRLQMDLGWQIRWPNRR